jgi:drug/metabolite transporter (DMT)-like permease
MSINYLGFLAYLSLLFVAILFVMQPVSSVSSRYWLGGEVLRTKQYVGTFSILLAMVSTGAGTYVKTRREAALG